MGKMDESNNLEIKVKIDTEEAMQKLDELKKQLQEILELQEKLKA